MLMYIKTVKQLGRLKIASLTSSEYILARALYDNVIFRAVVQPHKILRIYTASSKAVVNKKKHRA